MPAPALWKRGLVSALLSTSRATDKPEPAWHTGSPERSPLSLLDLSSPDATLSSQERRLTNVSTNVLKDTLTDDKSQRSLRPLAAAKVWKRGLGGAGKALSGTLQEPELTRVYMGSWSSGYLCVWRQERGG